MNDITCVTNRITITITSRPTSRKRNSPLIRQDAKCTFENCQTFQFFVDKDRTATDGVKLRLIISGTENHPMGQSRFRRTSEAEFDDISGRLKMRQPEEVYEDLMKEANITKLRSGNFNIPKSISAIRKMKGVLTSKEQLHKNVIIELHDAKIIHLL
jgi:hypothetical protein